MDETEYLDNIGLIAMMQLSKPDSCTKLSIAEKRMWTAWNERLLLWIKSCQFADINRINKVSEILKKIQSTNEKLFKLIKRDFNLQSIVISLDYCADGDIIRCVKVETLEVLYYLDIYFNILFFSIRKVSIFGIKIEYKEGYGWSKK